MKTTTGAASASNNLSIPDEQMNFIVSLVEKNAEAALEYSSHEFIRFVLSYFISDTFERVALVTNNVEAALQAKLMMVDKLKQVSSDPAFQQADERAIVREIGGVQVVP